DPGSRPRVYWRTNPPVFVTDSGTTRDVSLGSERLSSSKGQSQRKLATQSDGPWGRAPRGGRAAEGMDKRRKHRPSRDLRRQDARTKPPDLGPELFRYAARCPAFPPAVRWLRIQQANQHAGPNRLGEHLLVPALQRQTAG